MHLRTGPCYNYGMIAKVPVKRKKVPQKALQSKNSLDQVNVRLLRELQRDPRVPMATLARRVRMSAPAVTERVRRLEEVGVIAGFRMDVAPKALGLLIAAYVRIRPAPGQLAKVAELAERIPEVVECHRITGEDCFLLRVYVSDMDELESVLDRFLAFGQTTTSIVQSSPVPPRSLPLPSD
jgi:Lrp/AsnC family transcriptional regulator, leucine-responsive regulatory protein